ncbi:uncharacterized protein LOC127083391 [Lathyrus oleraceus]|uniref:Neprosin PEP catalytic domain-containing protein n=1 Tax=Pisum sativum TaxID=3888 RepID=A0A9D4X4H1_PEA|nr:uncharacterized protein LOC127083391 [Pisum sativum]KAI5412830.1 hypothetical protein KIW84_057452 [Pisum sativum]
MDFSSPMISLLLHILVIVSLFCTFNCLETSSQLVNQTFQSREELHKLKKIFATRLNRINKFTLKTIQSPDEDIIDCVLTHKQPAFDHPLLKGQKPLDPPKLPKGHNKIGNLSESFQIWSLSGESCPDGTIPIRRITEQEMLITKRTRGFGTKSTEDGATHIYANAKMHGGEMYGAKATINVWIPHVESPNEFSLSQIWVMSGTSGKDLNTVEAGWQVYPLIFKDNRSRLFIYWTADDYQHTGCYNLYCPGFVHINKRIALGAAISPTSTYNGKQFDITLSIWKDVKTGNWWLDYGSGNFIGYWPSSLFPNLKKAATEVHWGGEITNNHYPRASSTQMGSGHFAEEGFKKASYFKNMGVLDSDNTWTALFAEPIYSATNANCYSIKGGRNRDWGDHFYYGGPGKNKNCP